MLNEKARFERLHTVRIPCLYHSIENNRNQISDCPGSYVGGIFTTEGLGRTFGGNGNVRNIDYGASYLGVNIKTHQTVPLVHFVTCKLYLNKVDF